MPSVYTISTPPSTTGAVQFECWISSNLSVAARVEFSDDESERHKLCPGKKTSAGEPSELRSHARVLRGTALSI